MAALEAALRQSGALPSKRHHARRKIARPRYLTAHPILVDVVRRRSMLFAMI
jgi:hypothetical protein